jgi:hypothetical protein
MKLNEALEFVDRLFDALNESDKQKFAQALAGKCEHFSSLQLKSDIEQALTRPKVSRKQGPKTPRAEQKAQHEWLAKWVADQPGGVTTAGNVTDALLANFSSFAAHANPRSTAMGRVRTAAKLGLVKIDGLGAGTDWRQVSMQREFVVRERPSTVRAERRPSPSLGEWGNA